MANPSISGRMRSRMIAL